MTAIKRNAVTGAHELKQLQSHSDDQGCADSTAEGFTNTSEAANVFIQRESLKGGKDGMKKEM